MHHEFLASCLLDRDPERDRGRDKRKTIDKKASFLGSSRECVSAVSVSFCSKMKPPVIRHGTPHAQVHALSFHGQKN